MHSTTTLVEVEHFKRKDYFQTKIYPSLCSSCCIRKTFTSRFIFQPQLYTASSYREKCCFIWNATRMLLQLTLVTIINPPYSRLLPCSKQKTTVDIWKSRLSSRSRSRSPDCPFGNVETRWPNHLSMPPPCRNVSMQVVGGCRCQRDDYRKTINSEGGHMIIDNSAIKSVTLILLP